MCLTHECHSLTQTSSTYFLSRGLNCCVQQIAGSVNEPYVLDRPGPIHGYSSSSVRPGVVKLDQKFRHETEIAHCDGSYTLGWTEKTL